MLYYITNTNIPTKKAFGYGITKMCQSFSVITPVTLVIPKKNKREADVSVDLFSFYGLTNTFKVLEMPVIQASSISFLGNHISFLVEKISFAVLVFFLKITQDDICYSRDLLSLVSLRLKTKKLFLEIHYLSRTDQFLIKWISCAKKIIVITSFLKRELVAMGYKDEDILIAPDAVDLAEFESVTESKNDLRKRLSLPLDKKIVFYSGNLYPWKGVYTLVDAMERVHVDTDLVVVGGSDDTLSAFKKYCEAKAYAKRIHILGFKKHDQIPLYDKAADILVLPNSAQERISKYNTSPLKLFEYMASGNPIVASDLPSLREILNENNAYFAVADDPLSLGKVINEVLSNMENNRAKRAYQDVKVYTWENRSNNILKFIRNI